MGFHGGGVGFNWVGWFFGVMASLLGWRVGFGIGGVIVRVVGWGYIYNIGCSSNRSPWPTSGNHTLKLNLGLLDNN